MRNLLNEKTINSLGYEYVMLIDCVANELVKFGLDKKDMAEKLNKTEFTFAKTSPFPNSNGFVKVNMSMINTTIYYRSYEMFVKLDQNTLGVMIHELMHLFAIKEEIPMVGEHLYKVVRGMKNTVDNVEEGYDFRQEQFIVDEAFTELIKIKMCDRMNMGQVEESGYAYIVSKLEKVLEELYGSDFFEDMVEIYFHNPAKLFDDLKEKQDVDQEMFYRYMSL